MDKVVIFGTGKIAEVACSYFEQSSQYQVAAFTCDREYCADHLFLNKSCVPFDEVATHFPANEYAMFIALGYHQLNALRAERYHQAKAQGYRLVNYVHANAYVPQGVVLGDNCMILDGVTIQPGARLGSNIALWSQVVVGHHSHILDHCWLASGAAVGGGSRIGQSTFVGLNATIGHEVQIGERCLIGAHTLVTKNLADERVVADTDSTVLPIDSPRFLKISKLT